MSVTVGPFAFATQQLIFILGCLIALALAWIWTRQHNDDSELAQFSLTEAVFRIIAIGLISARLIFVIIYYDNYLAAPWQVLNIRDGGFNLIAGLVAALLWSVWEIRRAPVLRQGLLLSLLPAAALTFSASMWLHTHLADTPLPVTPLTTLNAEPIQLNRDFAERPVVINLWATWCPPCVREMPLLEEAANQWPEVAIIAVNQGETIERIEQFLQAQNLTLPYVFVDEQAAMGEEVGSFALPTTLFFNSDGSLSYTHVGEFSAATLENALRRLQ